jgi:hypothetical protein
VAHLPWSVRDQDLPVASQSVKDLLLTFKASLIVGALDFRRLAVLWQRLSTMEVHRCTTKTSGSISNSMDIMEATAVPAALQCLGIIVGMASVGPVRHIPVAMALLQAQAQSLLHRSE